MQIYAGTSRHKLLSDNVTYFAQKEGGGSGLVNLLLTKQPEPRRPPPWVLMTERFRTRHSDNVSALSESNLEDAGLTGTITCPSAARQGLCTFSLHFS